MLVKIPFLPLGRSAGLAAVFAIFLAFSQGHGQEVATEYRLLDTPFDSALALAANSTAVVVTTSDDQTFVLDRGTSWMEVATGVPAPVHIWTFQDRVMGVRDGSVLRLTDDGDWEDVATVPHLYWVRSYDGVLYGLARENFLSTTTVYRSVDGEGWVELTNLASAHIYDIVAHGSTIVVTEHSGRFYYSTDGENWHEGNVGAGDRLYAAIFAKGRFIFGGDGVYISDDLENWTHVELPHLVNRLHVAGGIVVALGGHNPASGRVSFSVDLEEWTQVAGSPFQAGRDLAFKDRRFLFLGHGAGLGSIGEILYRVPEVSVAIDAETSVGVFGRQGFRYSLESSDDLTAWGVRGLSFDGADEPIEWTLPVAGAGREFFRVVVEY